jgi:hypothetical protein
LRPRAGADGVDHAAGGQADHPADDRGGNHHDQAERPADRAQQPGGRIAHRRAGAGAAYGADHLAAVARCRFFNRIVALRRRCAPHQKRAKNGEEVFHVPTSNVSLKHALTR